MLTTSQINDSLLEDVKQPKIWVHQCYTWLLQHGRCQSTSHTITNRCQHTSDKKYIASFAGRIKPCQSLIVSSLYVQTGIRPNISSAVSHFGAVCSKSIVITSMPCYLCSVLSLKNCEQMLVLRSCQWLWPSWLFQFQSGWSDWWPPLQLWLHVYAYEQPNFLVFVQKKQLFSNMNTYQRNGCQWLYQVILACPTSLLLTLP